MQKPTSKTVKSRLEMLQNTLGMGLLLFYAEVGTKGTDTPGKHSTTRLHPEPLWRPLNGFNTLEKK